MYEFLATKPVFSRNEFDPKYHIISSCVIEKPSPKSISFSFKEGGTFIWSDFFSNDNKAGILSILAQLVTYSHIDDNSMKRCKRAVSDYVAELCSGSRQDSGERLMKRANRHAMDPKRMPLINCNGRIEKVKGHLCIIVHDKIVASMKKIHHKTTIALCAGGLFACSCNCPCGGDSGTKSVCVHVAGVAMRLSLLLCDGLAKHLMT